VLKQAPSRRGSIGRGGAAVLATALGVLVLAGCAAGQDAQTVGQRPAIDAASATSGNISVRAAALLPPTGGSGYAKGSSAQLQLVLINDGDSNDTLTAVSSPAASGAQIGAAGSSTGASDSASAGASDTASASASGSSSASASGTASAGSSAASTSSTASGSTTASASESSTAAPSSSAPSSSAASQPITLPPGSSVMIGFGDGPSISLTGLTQELFPAQSLSVTLTFGSGATITLTVPVALSSQQPSAPVISDATAGND
jgi:copper(I)-binding protein